MQQEEEEEEGKRTSCVFNALRAMSRESKRDVFFSGAHVYFRSGVSLFVLFVRVRTFVL